MNKMKWILGLCFFGLIAGSILTFGGCGGHDSPVAIQNKGALHGDWGGVHSEAISRTKAKHMLSINHEQGLKDFNGSMTLDGEQFNIVGSMENNVIHFVSENAKSIISYDGQYIAGRMNGTFTRKNSSLEKNPSSSGFDATAPTSGSFGLIQFLSIPDTIDIGPWLLYSQDNVNNLSNMTVRVGLNNKKLSADVMATDTTNGKQYGPFAMNLTANYTYGTTVVAQNYVGIFQHTFSGLPSNRSFSYALNIKDDKGKTSSATASFRTPPSWEDIKNGVVANQVFYSFGDNRREFGKEANNLPYVEENLVSNSDLTTDASAQSFLSHNGDATTLGQHFDQVTANTLWRHLGWKAEWLNSSNESKDDKGFDRRYHTWLRASVPTFMSVGNHEGKDMIEQGVVGVYLPKSFDIFGNLMAGIYNSNDDAIQIDFQGKYFDTYTYVVDHGGIRNIVLNTLNCYSRRDAEAVKSKIKTWIDGAYPGGLIILTLHPTLFVDSTEVGQPGCWHTTAQLKADLQPLIDNRKNVIVIQGHVHETARTVDKDVNYYVFGTGGAPDMTADKDKSWMVNFSSGKSKPYINFAYGQFSVDFSARKVTAYIYGMRGEIIDEHSWNY
jgi:hypothetical protein